MPLSASLAVALLAGLAHAVSIAAPWDGQPVWWLELLALALLAWQLGHAPSWRQGALLGWAFATALQVGTWWWLYVSLHTYGGLTVLLTVPAIVGLAGFLALYYAAVFGFFVAVAPVHWAWRAILFAAMWLLAELLRVSWFTGFPWGAAAYAHLDGPLAGWARWIGAHGIGLLAALCAALLAMVPRRPLAAVIGATAILGSGYLLPAASDPDPLAGRTLTVSLLQGNIPQDEKFQAGTGVADALRWYGAQLRDSTATLVVAPETAIPLLPQQLPDGYIEALQQRFGTGKQALLTGIPLGSYQDGYTNSVIGLQPGPNGQPAQVYRYDKHHLVPFGEFIPPMFKWFTELMNIPLGDFNRGDVGQPSFDWAGQRLAPNICYEDLFGEELGARFRDPATAPTIFVNVSNIGWFGDTLAIDQHLQISRLRALEFGRPMIRATNTGPTVIVDHRGHVTQSLQRHTRGVLTGQVEGRSAITPYAWWVARLGLWPWWGLCLLVAALALRRSKRNAP